MGLILGLYFQYLKCILNLYYLILDLNYFDYKKKAFPKKELENLILSNRLRKHVILNENKAICSKNYIFEYEQ